MNFKPAMEVKPPLDAQRLVPAASEATGGSVWLTPSDNSENSSIPLDPMIAQHHFAVWLGRLIFLSEIFHGDK